MAIHSQERERERVSLFAVYVRTRKVNTNNACFFFLVCLITMEALINSRLCKGSLCRQEDIEQLSMDGSQYSFSTGILPSLGGSSARRIKLKWFIISPYDRRYRCKSVLILGFSLWACDFLFSLRSFVCVYICAYKRLVIYCFYWFDFFFPCIIYMKDFLLCYSFWFMLDCRNLSLPYCSCSFNLFIYCWQAV